MVEGDATSVGLTTDLGNAVSQALYRGVGFRRTGERQQVIGVLLTGAGSHSCAS